MGAVTVRHRRASLRVDRFQDSAGTRPFPAISVRRQRRKVHFSIDSVARFVVEKRVSRIESKLQIGLSDSTVYSVLPINRFRKSTE